MFADELTSPNTQNGTRHKKQNRNQDANEALVKSKTFREQARRCSNESDGKHAQDVAAETV
jgi:hypothetical protein